MSGTTKKGREREILDLVFGSRPLQEVIDCESPDFLARQDSQTDRFGIEVVEFFYSETHARMQRIRNYAMDLLDGADFRHKDDKRNLDVTKVDLLTKDNEVKARGMSAIIQPVPSLAECAQKVAAIIDQKSEKLRKPILGLSHINLVIRDTTRLLDPFPVDNFFRIYFVPELRDAIARSPFREVFFITTMGKQVGYIPLNALYFLSQLFFFHCVLAQSTLDDISPADTNNLELFASYLEVAWPGTCFYEIATKARK